MSKQRILDETFENWQSVALYDSGVDDPEKSLFADKELVDVIANQVDREQIPKRIQGMSESRKELVVFYAIPRLVVVEGKPFAYSKDHFAATKDGFEIVHPKSKQVIKVSLGDLRAFLAKNK